MRQVPGGQEPHLRQAGPAEPRLWTGTASWDLPGCGRCCRSVGAPARSLSGRPPGRAADPPGRPRFGCDRRPQVASARQGPAAPAGRPTDTTQLGPGCANLGCRPRAGPRSWRAGHALTLRRCRALWDAERPQLPPSPAARSRPLGASGAICELAAASYARPACFCAPAQRQLTSCWGSARCVPGLQSGGSGSCLSCLVVVSTSG